MADRTQPQARPRSIGRRRWSALKRRNTINGILFALPWIVGLLVFWVYPSLASFYYSFTEFNGMRVFPPVAGSRFVRDHGSSLPRPR